MLDLHSEAICGGNLFELGLELLCQCGHDCSSETLGGRWSGRAPSIPVVGDGQLSV